MLQCWLVQLSAIASVFHGAHKEEYGPNWPSAVHSKTIQESAQCVKRTTDCRPLALAKWRSPDGFLFHGATHSTCDPSKHHEASGWCRPWGNEKWCCFVLWPGIGGVPWRARKALEAGCDRCHLPRSFHPWRFIHFLRRETGLVQTLPDHACLIA